MAAAQPAAAAWSESARCETLRVPRFPVPTTLCVMDPRAGAIEGPTPKQKAAAREVDRRMNYEEINESLEDRLGETTLVQVFHPVIRIGPVRHNYVYRLHFPSGVYQCDRGSEWGRCGERLFLFRNTHGPGP